MFGERFKGYPCNFLMLYAFTYMCNAIYNTFIPVYLDHLGFTRVSIGTLLAIGPFVALIAQPIWGIAGDRASTKNIILKALLIGSAIAVIMYPISSNYYYLIVIISTFTFFQTSINPISDAITLEYLETNRWKFGPIRMGGTIGYAIMSVLAGLIARQNINNIFILFSLVAVFAFISSFRLPPIKGHQSGGNKVAIWELFKNRELVILMTFSFIVQITMGFYYSFFPIYYRQLGADNSMLGWAMFISAICEVPFLLFANKILNKLGTKLTLVVSATVIAIRWLLLYSVGNTYFILGISMLHGFSFVVLTYCMATYINKEVPKELRASGQTTNGLISFGLSRILGSIFGGILSDMFGIRQVFLYVSLLDFAAIAVFGIIFIRIRAMKV
jgi:MFS transporter, PPP family, 3-phenylpropionic acid transporter